MARIRTIKPDFWTDESLTECSMSARLLFIGTWNFADDNGNIQRSAKQLKMKIFPADVIDCDPLVSELIAHGLLIEYSVNGEKFLHIKGFSTHQLINRPTKSNIPQPQFNESSLSTHGALNEDSLQEGKGREGKGKEEPTVLVSGKPPTSAEPISIDRVDCPMQAIADAWNAVAVSMPAVKSVAEWPDARKRTVKARWVDKLKLKKYTDRQTGVDYWTRLFARVEESDFLAGRTGGTFTATLDWVMNPTNLSKIIENGYPNRQAATA